MSDSNPFKNAAESYASTASTTDQRSLEGQILLKAARKLEELATRLQNGETVALEEVEEVLVYNRKLWQLFASDMANDEHPLPQEIKNNIASLAVYIFKRTHEILGDTAPEKFRILIEINRNIASGLMKKPVSQPSPKKVPAAPAGETITC